MFIKIYKLYAICPESGFRCYAKSDKNPENENDVITCLQDVIVGFLLTSSSFS